MADHLLGVCGLVYYGITSCLSGKDLSDCIAPDLGLDPSAVAVNGPTYTYTVTPLAVSGQLLSHLFHITIPCSVRQPHPTPR